MRSIADFGRAAFSFQRTMSGGCWVYRAEGAANAVFQYAGEDESKARGECLYLSA